MDGKLQYINLKWNAVMSCAEMYFQVGEKFCIVCGIVRGRETRLCEKDGFKEASSNTDEIVHCTKKMHTVSA